LREEERVRRENRGEVQWGGARYFPAWKIPRQCPPGLLVVISLREGKPLGSEKVKG
jgi:hypothetical protein